ncbi:MAG: hypothetical protein AAB512_05275 [Patescibacteria group bacterium]
MQLLLATISIFLLSFYPVSDSDFGWHLRTGEYIFNYHQVPHNFLFSFTNTDYQYVYYSWAAELLTYSFYKYFGLWGATVLYATILTTSILILIKTSLLFAKKEFFLPYFLVLTPFAHTVAGGRTIVFGLLFLSLIYFLFTKFKKNKSITIWLIPLVFLAWANFHASFIVGFPLLIYLFASGFIKGVSNPKFTLKMAFFVVALSFLATFVNPYFTGVWSQTILITTKELFNLKSVNPGWASPLNMGTVGIIFIFVLALISIFISSVRKVDLSQKIIIFALFVLSLVTFRFLFVLTIFLTPALYLAILEFKKRLSIQIQSSIPIKVSIFTLFSVLALIAATNNLQSNLAYASFDKYTYYISTYSPNKKLYSQWSQQAYSFFKENLKNKKVLTEANWGGLFILEDPQIKVFYYSAQDNVVLNSKPFPFEYLALVNATNGWQEKLDKYNVEVVFLPISYPIIEKLKRSLNWGIVYEDKTVTILAKN